MSAKNTARKSTGPRATSNLTPPQSNSTNHRTLRQRGSNQATNSTRQGDSSDSDEPTQVLTSRNKNSPIQSTSGSSWLSSQASTSNAAAVDSDDNEQSTLRLSNGKNRSSRRFQATESTESSTTSDSDEAPGRIKPTQEKGKPKKRRRINRRKNSSSETSEEDVPSSSSSRTSRSASSLNHPVSSPNRTALQPRDLAGLVNKCVHYLLIADQKKCLIKRTDIQKHVFTAGELKSYPEVMEEANAILKKTYGIEIIVSEERKGKYMLKNILSHDLGFQEFVDYPTEELQKRGFIFYLLTVIFMNEKSITDDELAVALQSLGIELNGRTPHPIFGDVNKYIKELAHQNYIERKQVNKDPPQFEFIWGERAYHEVYKKDLLGFACQIMGDSRPEEWILQYNDAMSKTQEPA